MGRDGLTDGDTCNVDQSDAQRFCDRDIQTDSFLQELHVELEHDDLANLPDPVPHFYESWHDLVRFLTSIVFQTTAQHSAVNNGQVRAAAPVGSCPLPRMRTHAPADTCAR